MDCLQWPRFEILDCTIRDGGYLNNWDFDKKMVKEVYRNISKTGVDVIELGFRNISRQDRQGEWHSVSEEILNELRSGISGIPISLMVDYGKADIDNIPESNRSAVKIYRVACHKDKVKETVLLCEKIKAKGYITSIQLMGIAGYVNDDLDALIKPFADSSIDYIYFADSYGSLVPQDIAGYIHLLKKTGKKIGFHAHNSLQLAFANTLEALRNGIDIVDATVFGMGRGAGNLPLETLVAYLEKMSSDKKYNVMPILDLIDRYFSRLHNELKWGYTLPYMLSGIFEVHPNYAKKLVDYDEYNIDDIVKTLEAVKEAKPLGFDSSLIDKIINSGFVSSTGKVDDNIHNTKELKEIIEKNPPKYMDRHIEKDFLILANGPTLKEYKTQIDEFINRYNPIVMGANYLGGLFKPHYHGFSNKKRFINYLNQVDESSIIMISSVFDEEFIKEYTNRDYEKIVHLNRASTKFEIKEGVITSNCRTISILLIAVAVAMGAKRVFIAGMDGYKNREIFSANSIHFYEEPGESKNFKLLMEKHNWNEILLNSINLFLISQNKEGLHIITPTCHRYFYNNISNWLK